MLALATVNLCTKSEVSISIHACKCAGGIEDSATALFHSARGRTWEPREGARRDAGAQERCIGQKLVLFCIVL